jgi:hypothetical protein
MVAPPASFVRNSAYRAAAVTGLIPYFKLGKAVRFRVAEVAAAIERIRVGRRLSCPSTALKYR